MKMLLQILIFLVCQGVFLELRSTCGMTVKKEIVQQRINPYTQHLHSLLREPPLRATENSLQKDLVQELWLEQKLDHFDATNNRTWLMRYLRNDRYQQPPHGPIYIFVGGEWEISPAYLLTGHLHDIARQHGGVLYYVEHRFYGQSWPAVDAAVENLRYLSARQALADLAHFIRQLKANEVGLAHTKVILAGASYSGSLVAWFAKLYPDLISAGWASSAPLVAKMDFREYMQQVGEVVEHRGGRQCSGRLESGLISMATQLESSNASQLLQALRVCNNFEPTNPLDRAALFNGIGNYFAAYAQLYDDQIASICAPLITPTDYDDSTAFIQFVRRIFWPEAESVKYAEDWCIDLSYEGMKSIFTDTTELLSGTRQWFYQSCHEFGWFITTTSGRQNARPKDIRQMPTTRRHAQWSPLQYSFGRQVSLNYFQQLCRVVFDPHSDTAAHSGSVGDISISVQQTNSQFGGLTAAIALQQRVIFTHGQLDPWRGVGLQEGKNVITIPDCSHTADLDSINFNDSVEMNVAKLKVAAFLRSVLRRAAN